MGGLIYTDYNNNIDTLTIRGELHAVTTKKALALSPVVELNNVPFKIHGKNLIDPCHLVLHTLSSELNQLT